MLSKTLIQLSADGWGCTPSLLVVVPEVTQSWSLGALWYGYQQPPGGFPPDCCCQCPCPHGGPLLTHSSAGGPQTLTGRSDSLFYGVPVPFPWVLVHTRFVCTLQEWSLCFPQSYGGPIIKFHWPSKSDSLGILSTFADPQDGEPDLGLRTFTTVRELLWYYSPVCGSPDRYRILFYRD